MRMVNRALFLSFIAAIGVISASLCAPALPFIADHFSVHFSYLQFTITLFLVGGAFGQFLSGPLSDQIGQRATLLGGLALYIIASCGCAVAQEMNVLLLCRFFQGMGSAAGPVIARAIAASTYPAEKSAQVQSYGAMGVGIASMAAIFSSGKLTLISWRGNFWLAAFLGIMLMIWAMQALKYLPLPAARAFSLKKIVPKMKTVVTHPQFLGAALCHSLTYGLMYGYITLFPFLLKELFHESNPGKVGVYSAYMIVFYMLGAFLASRLVLKWAQLRLIYIGIIIQLLSGTVLLFAPSLLFLLVALFLFNLSIGMILPLTSASALAPFIGSIVGTASTSLGLFYRLLGALLSMGIGQLPLVGAASLGGAIMLLSAISWLLMRGLLPRPSIS